MIKTNIYMQVESCENTCKSKSWESVTIYIIKIHVFSQKTTNVVSSKSFNILLSSHALIRWKLNILDKIFIAIESEGGYLYQKFLLAFLCCHVAFSIFYRCRGFCTRTESDFFSFFSEIQLDFYLQFTTAWHCSIYHFTINLYIHSLT